MPPMSDKFMKCLWNGLLYENVNMKEFQIEKLGKSRGVAREKV